MSYQQPYGPPPGAPQPAYGPPPGNYGPPPPQGYPQQYGGGYPPGPPGPPGGYAAPPPPAMAPPPQQERKKSGGCLGACLATLCCCFLCEESCECSDEWVNATRRDIKPSPCDFIALHTPAIPSGSNFEGNTPWSVETERSHWIAQGPPWSRDNLDLQETLELGLVEYMECVWAGFALNGDATPESELGPYVQDTLDELEFPTGSVDTEYGALRATLGHPEPWTINYVEVGNEDNLNEGLSLLFWPRPWRSISLAMHVVTITCTILRTNFVAKFTYFDYFRSNHPILLGMPLNPNLSPIYLHEQAKLPQSSSTDAKLCGTATPMVGSVAEADFLLGAERNTDKALGVTYVRLITTTLQKRNICLQPQAPFFMNLANCQSSPTVLVFNANPDETARSTSWHRYEVCTDPIPSTHLALLPQLFHQHPPHDKKEDQ
ncbi:hypothetical protein BDV28DRAFT_147356 [Aspergillus coremiiformis]|uniref:Uncharacterized protein n=1 Tax=Aspergillus coremiiformis TaxID=138285 RepID=A0A5N6ZDM4_9EURO|nr:hypothetical protein BDV28DRAFT_147356 [Aspergillus coremiiformis]